ncbi:hypothetical protein PIB30_047501 [Stylosanthes scabra]|uniref:Uncharacterized protein n=1 Tax=Stylosanthes scabra TaxID=79078 RepID=A0ABU6UG44_9FABA|nr:hypothetical protein [Stylosanthes scabra]
MPLSLAPNANPSPQHSPPYLFCRGSRQPYRVSPSDTPPLTHRFSASSDSSPLEKLLATFDMKKGRGREALHTGGVDGEWQRRDQAETLAAARRRQRRICTEYRCRRETMPVAAAALAVFRLRRRRKVAPWHSNKQQRTPPSRRRRRCVGGTHLHHRRRRRRHKRKRE